MKKIERVIRSANRYLLTEGDYSYFGTKYGISRGGLRRLIHRIEELDFEIGIRKQGKPTEWIISLILQEASESGLSYRVLMRVVSDLEKFNDGLKERSFGMLLKKYRRLIQYTVSDLSEETGISLGFISSIESGLYFPTPKKAEMIADVLGLRDEARKMYFQVYRKERGQRSLTGRCESSEESKLGSLLRQARIAAGRSQAELGEMGIINPIGLCRIERGDLPTVRTLRKLAKFYGLDEGLLIEMRLAEKQPRQRRVVEKPYRTNEERARICICRSSPGKMLKSLREREGVCQKQLADELAIHFSYISYWESDKRAIGLKYIDGIAKFLNLSEEEKEELEEKLRHSIPVNRQSMFRDRVRR